jgi:hypothetical protein
MNGVKEVAMVPVTEQPGAAIEPSSVMQMIERLASNPQFDAAKLEQLIDLQMRVTDYQAKAAFDAAFPAMQADIPTIPERGKTNNGRYALLEDIIEAARPILKQHGFFLSFRTEWPGDGLVCVVGVLTHQAGHSRESSFRSSADNSGNKNPVQALGSVVAYGQRYTAKDLLGIVTRGVDDDAVAAKVKTAAVPAGYDAWMADLELCAADGYPVLERAWKESKAVYRDYLQKQLPGKLDQLKAKARGVK